MVSYAFAYSGELREDNDIRQKVIADLLHVSQPTYSRYETGELGIPSFALVELAKFYCTSTDYLLGLPQYEDYECKGDIKEMNLDLIIQLANRADCETSTYYGIAHAYPYFHYGI